MAKLLLFLFLVGFREGQTSATTRRRPDVEKCRSGTYEIECEDFTDADSLPDRMRSFKTSIGIRGNFTTLPLREGAGFPKLERLRVVSRHPDFPNCRRLATLLLNGTLPLLAKIDLRGGVLTRFDFSCLPSHQLSVIDLSGNRISSLRGCEALRGSDLREIRMSGNRLVEFDLSCLPSTVEILRLESNRIAALRSPERLLETRIRKIYLQLNRIVEFDFSALPRDLMKIDLNFNRIARLDLSGLRVSDRAKLLVFDNPINETCGLISHIHRLVISNRVGLYLNSSRWDPTSGPGFDDGFGCYRTVGEDQISTRVYTVPVATTPEPRNGHDLNSGASLEPSTVFYLFVSLTVSSPLLLF